MLIQICGNCKNYRYNNGPGNNGGCKKDNGETTSPLAPVCKDYTSKKK